MTSGSNGDCLEELAFLISVGGGLKQIPYGPCNITITGFCDMVFASQTQPNTQVITKFVIHHCYTLSSRELVC